MADRPLPKRSKSARIAELLRGNESTSKDGDSGASATAAASGDSENRPSSSSPQAETQQTMDARSSNLTASSSAHSAGNSGSQSHMSSIEDSVRTFKIFEALRSGDDAAVDKVIEECRSSPSSVSGTTIVHLAVQCAEPHVVEKVISSGAGVDVNAQDKEGNTPLHLAAQLGRAPIVKQLLDNPNINDAIQNHHGRTPIDLARTPDIYQQLQLARALFVDHTVKQIQGLAAHNDYKKLEALLVEPRVEGSLDVNSLELATERETIQSGGTLLHEAARKRDLQLAQLLLLHGADPFRRDRKGKLPQDVTKDDRTKAILKKSPAAAVAQRGIQEKAILGSNPSQGRLSTSGPIEGSKDSREMKGYLKKWTNYTSGYKLRWFVLEDGVLSYYKHQDDAGSACRGAINMRIARLHMDPQDKTRFEIHGKSSVKYHLKANHVVEAKRWYWSLNNAIQYTKDEAKEDSKRRTRDLEALRQAKMEATDSADGVSMTGSTRTRPPPSSTSGMGATPSKVSVRGTGPSNAGDDNVSNYSYEASAVGDDGLAKIHTNVGTATIEAEEDMDGEDASSHELQPANKDAFNITAQSAKVQLDLLGQVSGALTAESAKNPHLPVSDPSVAQALSTYSTALSSLNGLVADLLKISRDRDAYWQYRLDREADARRMWEESMRRMVEEHEDLQKSMGESEEKRKRTKRALKEALEEKEDSRPPSAGVDRQHIQFGESFGQSATIKERSSTFGPRRKSLSIRDGNRRKSVIAQFTNLSDSESGDDDEFFDAVDAGEVEVVAGPLTSAPLPSAPEMVEVATIDEKQPFHVTRGEVVVARAEKEVPVEHSYAGYEDGIRKRLKMDADDRPKISLWGILKSMIGKDMTKMTLPVSFNEPTSLLQRVAEDMEYADLLDIAAQRPDKTERLVYVAAFAASEYASTIGRVAKPFNPLLGETYEYVRPDKGYRFVIEQVSHHPPVGAAWAESTKGWEYWGESAVRSKFYGKSFDINPLGTWFLKITPPGGQKEELYTWKKVTSSVVGIITGNPTVDNYGPMEIKNHTTGEVCLLDFKQRGWKASSAYQVQGKVVGADGVTKWSLGGRWNSKIFARQTEGFEDESVEKSGNQAVLLWQANSRPTGIPFNLTPFVVTLNAVPDALRARLPPTDTRLRPDQRAMEDGEYDRAAVEKNRVEEKQRAARRLREGAGDEWAPKWFARDRDPVTGEVFWRSNGAYWKMREQGEWSRCDDIF